MSVPEFLLKYMVEYDKSAPLDIPTEEREKWRLGNDALLSNAMLVRRGVLNCITMVTRVSFNVQRGVIILELSNGVRGIAVGVDEDNIKDVVSAPIEVIIARSQSVPVIHIKRIYGRVDNADELIDKLREENVPLYDALLMGFGYKPCDKARVLMLPRILSLFRVNGMPLYTLQITPRATGKTEFGTRVRDILNWAYTGEAPSFAFLIYDARTRSIGQVFLRNGIVFDGIDKWGEKIWNISTDYELLLTGMEQGVWSRGVSGAPVSGRKYVNMLFFGNVIDASLQRLPDRECTVAAISIFGDPEPFLDRIVLTHYSLDRVDINELVTGRVLPDSVMRYLINHVQELIDRDSTVYTSNLEGRLSRHSASFQKAVRNMGVSVDSDTADVIVGKGLDYALNVENVSIDWGD